MGTWGGRRRFALAGKASKGGREGDHGLPHWVSIYSKVGEMNKRKRKGREGWEKSSRNPSKLPYLPYLSSSEKLYCGRIPVAQSTGRIPTVARQPPMFEPGRSWMARASSRELAVETAPLAQTPAKRVAPPRSSPVFLGATAVQLSKLFSAGSA
ncbi:hypothetical protein NL676_021274 [Syzygium grande]|nr:hypothetical protein NL676_021274 [Syzygium grande]